MGFQAAGVCHLGDLPSALFDGKLVQGERIGLILDLQVPLIDPHRHVFPGQPSLAIFLLVMGSLLAWLGLIVRF